MNKKLILIPVLIVVVGLVINQIVNPDKTSELGCNFTAQVPDCTPSGTSVGIKSQHLYIDFSGSMRGFIDFSGVADAKDAKSTMLSTVTTYLDKLEASYNIKTVNHCGGKTYTKDEFRRQMQSKSIFNGGVTLLQDLVAEKCRVADDTTVVTIVSDMVLSYGRAKLNKEGDIYYNKHNLDGLNSVIHGAMTSLKQRELDVLLLQYYSHFNGNYYYNCTENIEGAGAYKGIVMEDRPFYIMLIGKEDSLKDILSKNCLKEAVNVYSSFGIEDSDMKTVPFSISESKETDYWTMGANCDAIGTFWTSTDLGKEKTTFVCSCDGFKIPAYLGCNSLSGECNVGDVDIASIRYDKRDETLDFNVTVKPFDQLGKSTEVDIRIISSNHWKDGASTDDDVNMSIDSLKGKTWGLSGVLEAMDKVFKSGKSYDGDMVGTFSFVLYKN